MNKRFSAIAASLIGVFFIFQAAAFAHEAEKHGKGHNEEAQMSELHRMMPVYAQAQAKINEALGKGDAKTVKTETGKIVAAIQDLKRAKPHKNPNELKQYREIALHFDKEVELTAELAGKGDLAGATAAFRRAGEKCDECHAKFR